MNRPASTSHGCSHCREQLFADRIEDHACQRATCVFASDADAEQWDAGKEVRRAIERVNDPAQTGRAGAIDGPLLGDDAVVRSSRADHFRHGAFGRAISFRDEIRRVALRSNAARAAAEAAVELAARTKGRLNSDVQDIAGHQRARLCVVSVHARSFDSRRGRSLARSPNKNVGVTCW